MWPWGHLAVGYLLYSVVVHLWARRRPGDVAAIALAFGTQFPDLVDKPLAWRFDLIPNGRSLTHSLVTAALLVLFVQFVFRRLDRGAIATAFSIGYLSHLFADALYPALEGEREALLFLAWPLVPPVEYATEPIFAAQLRRLFEHGPSALFTSSVGFEIGLAAVVFLLWLVDGAPGIGWLVSVPQWIHRKLSSH